MCSKKVCVRACVCVCVRVRVCMRVCVRVPKREIESKRENYSKSILLICSIVVQLFLTISVITDSTELL